MVLALLLSVSLCILIMSPSFLLTAKTSTLCVCINFPLNHMMRNMPNLKKYARCDWFAGGFAVGFLCIASASITSCDAVVPSLAGLLLLYRLPFLFHDELIITYMLSCNCINSHHLCISRHIACASVGGQGTLTCIRLTAAGLSQREELLHTRICWPGTTQRMWQVKIIT